MIDFISFFLVLISTLNVALGTLIIKKGTLKYSFKQLFFTSYFFFGLLFYAASSLLYIIALRREELSVLYPLVSTSYIWVTLLSVRYLKEKMTIWKWLALTGIIIGVTFIGIGS